jgi:hypothetical protein
MKAMKHAVKERIIKIQAITKIQKWIRRLLSILRYKLISQNFEYFDRIKAKL